MKDFFKHQETNRLVEMIEEYNKANKRSPLNDVYIEENTLKLEILQDFEEQLEDEFDNAELILEDYIQALRKILRD